MVAKLASVGCTVGEIASVLGCNRSTLQRRFAAAIEKGFEEGNASLRKKQFELAMTGDRTMLVWLGKQRLGQSDQRPESVEDAAEAARKISIALKAIQEADGLANAA
jgi:AraC-like DNA-binding protein